MKAGLNLAMALALPLLPVPCRTAAQAASPSERIHQDTMAIPAALDARARRCSNVLLCPWATSICHCPKRVCPTITSKSPSARSTLAKAASWRILGGSLLILTLSAL